MQHPSDDHACISRTAQARSRRTLGTLIASCLPVPEVQAFGVRLHPQPLQARPAIRAQARHRVRAQRRLPPVRTSIAKRPCEAAWPQCCLLNQAGSTAMNASRTFVGGPALPAQHACQPCLAQVKRKPKPRRQRTRKPSSSSSAPATLLSCTRPSSEPLNRRVVSRGWKLTWRGALN